MNSVVSLSSCSAGQSDEAAAMASCHQTSRPDCISTGPPVRRRTTHFCHAGRFGQGFVNVLFQRQLLAATPAIVGGDLQLGLGVVVAVGDRFAGKTAKNHGMHRPNPSTGQHGNDQLGNHRQVDRDHVALRHAQRLEDPGELADLAMQLGVSELPRVSRLAFPDECQLVLDGRAEMPVETVERGVCFSADEPLGEGLFPIEHALPRLNQCNSSAGTSPKTLQVVGGFAPQLFVGRQRRNAGTAGKLGRRRKKPRFLHDRVDLAAGLV